MTNYKYIKNSYSSKQVTEYMQSYFLVTFPPKNNSSNLFILSEHRLVDIQLYVYSSKKKKEN